MKYSEFREYLTLNELHFQEDEESLVANYHIEISKTEEHRIEFLISNIKYPFEYEMLKKAIELAETPLSKRGEEKMKMFLIFDREAEELSILSNDEAIDYINELELPLSNDPDEGDFIIKYLDDEEIKELAEFYEIFVTELKKFRGKESFKIEPFYLTGGERNEI